MVLRSFGSGTVRPASVASFQQLTENILNEPLRLSCAEAYQT
jgi:hypothetical protein